MLAALAVLNLGAPAQRQQGPGAGSGVPSSGARRQRLLEALSRHGHGAGVAEAATMAAAAMRQAGTAGKFSDTTLASTNPNAPVNATNALNELHRDMNGQADPCVDFYAYACGSWMKNTQRQEDEPSISRGFSSLVERVDTVIHEVFRASTPKLSEFFAECVNYEGRNEQQAIPIAPWIQLIDEATTLEAIFFAVGRMSAFGMSPLVGFFVDVSPEDPDQYSGMLYPDGFGLDDPYLYLSYPEGFPFMYRKYLASLLELSGVTGTPGAETVEEQAKAVWALEYNMLLVQILSSPADEGMAADGPGLPGDNAGPGGPPANHTGKQGGGRSDETTSGGKGNHEGDGGVAGGMGGGARGAPHRSTETGVAGGAAGGSPGGGKTNGHGGSNQFRRVSAQEQRNALRGLRFPPTVRDYVLFDDRRHQNVSWLARGVVDELRSKLPTPARPTECKKNSLAPCALWAGASRRKRKDSNKSGGANGNGNGNGGNGNSNHANRNGGGGNGGGSGGDGGNRDQEGTVSGGMTSDTGIFSGVSADTLPWKEFFEGAGFPENVNQLGKQIELHPSLDGLALLLPEVPIPMLQAYLKTQLLNHVQSYLSADFLRISYNWQLKQFKMLSDEEGLPPPLTVSDASVLPNDYLEEACQEHVSEMVPFLVGKEFSDRMFDVESQKMANTILDGIRKSLRYSLQNEEHWMDAVTRQHALAKLDKMVDKIGYPNMHTAGEGAGVRRDAALLAAVDELYVHEPHAEGETSLLLTDASARGTRSRLRLKAAKDVTQPGPLELPLRLPQRLKGRKAADAPRASLLTGLRKPYSQQQMQMGGYPPEAWEKEDAQPAASAPPPPFKLDDELTDSFPHKTPDPPEMFAHYYGYFGKSMAAANFAWRRDMKKIGNVVDRSEWFMSPQTVNAYYSPQWNEMVFPVAILQPPFFHKSFHPSMNFASIGAIMGHEMTHGFDNNGRKFNKDGDEVDWWRPAALEEFLSRAQCVVDLYSNFSEFGTNLSGENEVGENIADFGGVKLGFRAMKEYLREAKQRSETFPAIPNGLTPEQLFFVSYGQTWCTKSEPDYVLSQIAQDEHSPPRERVNGPLISSPDFHEAFQCPLGTPMNPTNMQQCKMW